MFIFWPCFSTVHGSTCIENKKLQESYHKGQKKGESYHKRERKQAKISRRLTGVEYWLSNIHYLTNEHVALNSIIPVFCTALTMVQYFAVLLILCFPGGSLGTTTSPQQQTTANLKDLCEVRNAKDKNWE